MRSARSSQGVSPDTTRSFALAALGTALSAALALAGRPAWAAAPIKVACVGEQTTHSDQLSRTVEYPAMLQTELGTGYDAQNFGDCCSTVLSGYPKQPETHPYLLGGSAPSYKESLVFAPDIVVIGSWGKHDTEIANSLYAGVLDATKFETDYETLVTTYLNLPNKPRVFVSTPVPIPKGAPTGPTTLVILPTVKAIAAKYNLPIVDLYPAFLNQPQLYKDDTHVSNVAGLQKIADTVFAEITGTPAIDDAGAGPSLDAGSAGVDGSSVPPGSPIDASVSGGETDAGSAPPPSDVPSTPTTSAKGCTASPVPASAPQGARGGASALLGIACALFARRRRASARRSPRT